MMMLLNIQVGISDANNSLFGLEASLSIPTAEANINPDHTCYDLFNECTFNCDRPIDCITCQRVDADDPTQESTCTQ